MVSEATDQSAAGGKALLSSLRRLGFPLTLNTSEDDLHADFFVPALRASVRYDRGVGFFSSGWLRMAAKGMADFAANGGRARWVTSPILSPDDWRALNEGEAARDHPVLVESMRRNVADLEHALERDTLAVLAWLVADEILTFKLALPVGRLENGDFHDKFGVFIDQSGDRISFNGSYNDSIQGTRNYESLKIFSSWSEAFCPLVQDDEARFERLWSGRDPNVRVFDLPEAAREQIVQLRSPQRPYPKPLGAKETKVEVERSSARPQVPSHVTLREYQQKAIDNWFDANCQGLLEMATGTGKTITALAASARLFEREGRLAVVIAVPFQHLVDQWRDEARAFGYEPLLAYISKTRWLNEMQELIADFNAGRRNFISIIVTHTTFSSSHWEEALAKLRGPSLLIADEAHHLGAENHRKSYPPHIPFRLALSATPDRHFDDTGTSALRKFFGSTVFSLPLKEAIGLSLTPYYYYPHLVPLTDDELDRYSALTLKIARIMGRSDSESEDVLTLLLSQRADLLNKAENKLPLLSSLVDKGGVLDKALFYCAPGQIHDVTRMLGWEKGLQIHKFTYEEDAVMRKQLLSEFASGDLQALVAMKCLDEGVDVPGTRMAYFLASSSNPREFIQRRGRILRKAPGKEHAIVHDLIAIPPASWSPSPDSPAFSAERSIVRRELARFWEFASCALNKHEAVDVIWDLAKRYSLMDAFVEEDGEKSKEIL